MKDLVAEITGILEEYTEDVSEKVEKELEKTAKETVKELKATDDMFKTHYRGYAKGWSVKKTGNKNMPSFIIHNKKHGRLTHLLENGHVMVVHGKRMGRVRAIKHIEPIANKYIRKLPERIKESLE